MSHIPSDDKSFERLLPQILASHTPDWDDVHVKVAPWAKQPFFMVLSIMKGVRVVSVEPGMPNRGTHDRAPDCTRASNSGVSQGRP